MKKQPAPPYFDPIIKGLSQQDSNTQAAFGRHVHWGYWHDPELATGSPEKFGVAAEELCNIVCNAARINEGMRVVDVGCGFGGTLGNLNERYSNLTMVGINIDARQLARAAELIKPNRQNSIHFIEANASRIPCPDNSFDSVLSVESIFHFDRGKFFGEAKRLLSEGGTLTVSDFVISERASRYINGFDLFDQEVIREAYGEVDLSYSVSRYRELAREHGFVVDEVIDITENTMPTYDFLLSKSNGKPNSWHTTAFLAATRFLQKASHKGAMTYQILRFALQSSAG